LRIRSPRTAPVGLEAAVRTSRHTFKLIEAAETFTVSVPTTGMAKELEACGTLSGRTTDKFNACRLATRPATKVRGPVLAIPGYHYELSHPLLRGDPGLLRDRVSRSVGRLH